MPWPFFELLWRGSEDQPGGSSVIPTHSSGKRALLLGSSRHPDRDGRESPSSSCDVCLFISGLVWSLALTQRVHAAS